jgi:hypothetical protein
MATQQGEQAVSAGCWAVFHGSMLHSLKNVMAQGEPRPLLAKTEPPPMMVGT